MKAVLFPAKTPEVVKSKTILPLTVLFTVLPKSWVFSPHIDPVDPKIRWNILSPFVIPHMFFDYSLYGQCLVVCSNYICKYNWL